MQQLTMHKYIDILNRVEGIAYLYTALCISIAPTLEGAKPASLFTFTKGSKGLLSLWEAFKVQLPGKLSVAYYELKRDETHCVVLFYNPYHLLLTLQQQKSKEFLQSFGYEKDTSLGGYLRHLKRRYQEGCPHEMGIFLGFPVEDVAGFIACRGREYLLNGYWKVYHDPETAMKTFKRYDEAKEKMMVRLWEQFESYKR